MLCPVKLLEERGDVVASCNKISLTLEELSELVVCRERDRVQVETVRVFVCVLCIPLSRRVLLCAEKLRESE